MQYDGYPRKSLLDHFYDRAYAGGRGPGRSGRARAISWPAYEARLRRNPGRIQVQLVRKAGRRQPLRITKGVTLEAGSNMLEIAYLLEGLPPDRPLHFAVEMNFAGLPAGADDRYFYGATAARGWASLAQQLDLAECAGLGLVDEWLGIDVGLRFSRPTRFWAFPVETVSQSEGGFELVHQSVVVQPHWISRPTPTAAGA